MKTLAKWIGWIVLAYFVVLVAVAVFTARPGDLSLWPPVADDLKFEVHVVSHGYHSGIVVARSAARDRASQQNNHAVFELARRFAAYRWLEIGWGDEGFYRLVPDIGSVTIMEAWRALFGRNNPSILHVVGLMQDPRVSFATSEVVRIELSPSGFGRLIEAIDASFAGAKDGAPIDDTGPGLYGPSRFYRAIGAFNIFNDCNHWVARLLAAAGLPSAPVLATLPQGLLLDLQWRAGLVPLPKPAAGALK